MIFEQWIADQLTRIDERLADLERPDATQRYDLVTRARLLEEANAAQGDLIDELWQWGNGQDQMIRVLQTQMADEQTKSARFRTELDSQGAWNNGQDADMRGVWAKDAAQDGAIGAARSVADDAAAKASTANAKANSVYRDLVRLWQELYQKSVVVNPPPSADPT